jgi:hypothetical protein
MLFRKDERVRDREIECDIYQIFESFFEEHKKSFFKIVNFLKTSFLCRYLQSASLNIKGVVQKHLNPVLYNSIKPKEKHV